MQSDIPYHSALSKGKMEQADPLPIGIQHMDYRGNVVFVWDVNDGTIPEPYTQCDLIYAEPSWPAGLKAFDQRAGVNSPPYSEYAKAMGNIISTLGVPAIMMVSKIALRYLPTPDFTTTLDLNGNKADVGFWNGAYAPGDDNRTLIRNLAQQDYKVVGDFCCGYGTTGRLFIEAGKMCVLSDYNAECCGYVAKHMEAWG